MFLFRKKQTKKDTRTALKVICQGEISNNFSVDHNMFLSNYINFCSVFSSFSQTHRFTQTLGKKQYPLQTAKVACKHIIPDTDNISHRPQGTALSAAHVGFGDGRWCCIRQWSVVHRYNTLVRECASGNHSLQPKLLNLLPLVMFSQPIFVVITVKPYPGMSL